MMYFRPYKMQVKVSSLNVVRVILEHFFLKKVKFKRQAFYPYHFIMYKFQPEIICSKLTIETLEQG